MEIVESEILELKESWHDVYLKTICAFANTRGGKLIIGITDKKEPVSKIFNSKELLENIPNKIVSKLGIIATLKEGKFKNKKVIIIQVDKSDVPTSYNGQYFIRIGSTTQTLQSKELSRFLINSSLSNWDEYIVTDAEIEDINLDTIELFKKFAIKRLPFVNQTNSLEELLIKLNLLDKQNRIKRGAVLLFGKNPKQFFISAFIKIGRFNDDGSIISSDVIEGNLFEQVEKTIEIIKTKYLVSNIKIKGLYREEHLAIPEEALREAIINAVIHRDYIGTHTQIKIYRDYINIWNEGMLPKSINIKNLKTKHPSRPRNELLADIFFKAGLIEAWGQGTLEIINLCRTANLPEPEYKEEFGGFSTTFFQSDYSTNKIKLLNLNSRQEKTIEYLKENNSVTNSIYQKFFKVSKGTATKDLNDLLEKDLIVREGSRGAGTFYKLKP
jgi:ATP-dependent DNA helicase RecG